MPNKNTFKIKPITELLLRYVGDGASWADPFANTNSPAEITNDINAQFGTTYNLDAHEFAKKITRIKGLLFDPPYSLEQMKRAYENVGRKFTQRDGQICNRWTELKNDLAPKIDLGGYVISFGWNTQGFGKGRGFEIVEILVIAHGSGHNDTLVTVENKIKSTITL